MSGDPQPGSVIGPAAAAVAAAVARSHRDDWTAVVAATVRVAGDLDVAEDCVQEAYVSALQAWAGGVPANPTGWLITTARRKALDQRRRAQVLTGKLSLLIEPDEARQPDEPADTSTIVDDQLRLVFTCCHPALERQAQAALTLRTVCGMRTSDVARAFLVPDATMAARLTRAKKKIATARIPYRVPDAAELPDRLDAVLTVGHLLVGAAHSAGLDDPALADELAARSLRLVRTLVTLMPDEHEPRGLLALALLTEARRPARVRDGQLVLLGDQDRSLWDADLIAEGLGLVSTALRGPRTGRFALQAAIAALHVEAPTARDTDWPQVLGLYDRLLAVWPSHVVALNRCVAVGEVHGPAAALEVLDALAAEPRLAGYVYVHATRADLLLRLDRPGDAAAAYATAVELADNGPERDFLMRRLAAAQRSDERGPDDAAATTTAGRFGWS